MPAWVGCSPVPEVLLGALGNRTHGTAGPGGRDIHPTMHPDVSVGSGSFQPFAMKLHSASAETASTSGCSFEIQLEGKGEKM